MTDFDIAILGLGVMGSACAHALSRRGARVIAFDQLTPPHTMGSSHGHTRIIREAYYEHPLYVPLVRRAYELWSDLQHESGAKLFDRTGGLMVGPPKGPLLRGALDSARTHSVDHDVLDARALQERFPAYLARKDWLGLFERRAGMLFPERCIEALLASAREEGATLRFDTKVEGWRREAGGRIRLALATESITVKQLIVAAGSWLPGLSDSLGVQLPLEIERQLSHWFQPEENNAPRFQPANCPIALWEMPDGDVFATFPDAGHGVKCGMHHAGASTSPETVNRSVTQGENAVARELLETVMPGAGGRLLEARVCLYTNTPDRHFIIDWVHPNDVLLLSPCSGHGFKFASAIGEIAAQLALDGKTWLDLKPFSLARFRSG
jgi:sarcosine oxidase